MSKKSLVSKDSELRNLDSDAEISVDHDHEDIMSQLTLASSTVPADMGRARRDGFSENDSGPAHPYKSLRPTGAPGVTRTVATF